MNISLSFLPSVGPAIESDVIDSGTTSPINDTSILDDDIDFYMLAHMAAWIFMVLVGLFGMAANGTVIWILGCHMKKNAFTTYILNLSVVDFALLSDIVSFIICESLWYLDYIPYYFILDQVLSILFIFTFSASQLILTVISIDRCVCLFFPLWYKCHRPLYLSTILCVIVWILTFLISALDIFLAVSLVDVEIWYHPFLLNVVLCTPAIFISTIAMLIKVCFMSPHQNRGKLLTAILLALLFFLLFAFPLNATTMFFRYHTAATFYFKMYALMGAPLNSAINPVIYFLIGRDKTHSRGKIRKAYEKLFQEEESCREGV